MKIDNLSTDNFYNTIKESDKMILVDFYADWCTPCKIVSPVVAQIAEENEGVKVYKVNIDENPQLAVDFDVRSIPNLISFKGGEVYKRLVGAYPKESIMQIIS